MSDYFPIFILKTDIILGPNVSSDKMCKYLDLQSLALAMQCTFQYPVDGLRMTVCTHSRDLNIFLAV